MPPSTTRQVILITGASSGIGKAAARLFGSKGYMVAASARRFDRLQSLCAEIEAAGGDAFPVGCDVSQLEEIHRAVDIIMEHYGRIDTLFNNAGFGRLNWLENLDPIKDIEAQLQVNLNGVIQMTRAVLPHMLERRSGHIINMVSLAGLTATPTYSIYAASKFGVRGFTDALRREVRSFGIQVSAIYPGGVATEFTDHARIRRKTRVTTPASLRLQPEDVAEAVLRLARRPRRMVVIPWQMKLGVWFSALFPGIADWIMTEYFVKPEKRL